MIGKEIHHYKILEKLGAGGILKSQFISFGELIWGISEYMNFIPGVNMQKQIIMLSVVLALSLIVLSRPGAVKVLSLSG